MDQSVADIEKSFNLPYSQVFVAGYSIIICHKIGKDISIPSSISPLDIPQQSPHPNKRKFSEL